jgi:hypothetical protein
MQHRRSKIIALGRRGLAIAQIKRLVGGADQAPCWRRFSFHKRAVVGGWSGN